MCWSRSTDKIIVFFLNLFNSIVLVMMDIKDISIYTDIMTYITIKSHLSPNQLIKPMKLHSSSLQQAIIYSYGHKHSPTELVNPTMESMSYSTLM